MTETAGRQGLDLSALSVGQRAEEVRRITPNALVFYTHASGDLNPLHIPELDGDGDGKPEGICPPAFLASLISSVVGQRLPGPGSRERAWRFETGEPVCIGDEVAIRVHLIAKHKDYVTLSASVDGPDGPALSAELDVVPPRQSRHFGPYDLPDLMVHRHRHFERFLSACSDIAPAVTAVICPQSEDALAGALAAADRDLITPVLVGDPDAIAKAAQAAGRSIDGIRIEAAPDAQSAAALACKLVADGQAQSLMKGHLHTDTLLRAVLNRSHGLRTERRLSHVFVMDVPAHDKLLLVTDAAVNIAPDLQAKADITQNAIDLARALGIALPKVGILSAVETINPALPSTLDAAALSKMADRGQITGGLVDGPLAMDNAVDLEAARVKGLTGAVAGRADILVAPNLEAGNMLAKELTFVARAESAGVVLGAAAPVILTSRADSEFSRLMSCAVAALHAQWLKTGHPAPALTQPAPEAAQ